MSYGKFDYHVVDKKIASDKKISELKTKKRKLKFKRGLYGLATAAFVLASASVGPLLGEGVSRLNGRSIFKLDDIEYQTHIKKEFNSNKDLEITKQYYPYESESNRLYYYDGWKDNGEYFVSNETVYNINGLTYEEVINSIDKDGNINVGKIISKKTVYKRDITKDMNMEPYYEGVIYEVDKNDTITVTETKEQNADTLAKVLIITALLDIVAGYITFTILRYEYPFKELKFKIMLTDARINKEKKENRKLVKKLIS